MELKPKRTEAERLSYGIHRKGLRDRKMRLSLNVARRFFGLQDMLGFDKASNTVEWLLNQAKAEINRLAKEKKK
ncbi:hypothetical protein VIGAN_11159700 [Vigna angularis var. angularis]|uniref:TCP domain-containing protein n=1 Tax=Vigna angularis var. angularis TaxID=157739 RepID=A0A0S3TAB2_PHAAN|nr:hypothetical protein VIGAN_11159700 [Vigna angularis var. angularis]